MITTEDYGNSLMSIRYKLVLVGDICVGKTAIMNRFIKNEYNLQKNEKFTTKVIKCTKDFTIKKKGGKNSERKM